MSGSSPIHQDRTFAQQACFLLITTNLRLSRIGARFASLLSGASSVASAGELMDPLSTR